MMCSLFGRWMCLPTQKIESADASTDPSLWVSGCIQQLLFLGRWMYPPTHNLELEDASADPINIFKYVDASDDPKTRVGKCIHQPRN